MSDHNEALYAEVAKEMERFGPHSMSQVDAVVAVLKPILERRVFNHSEFPNSSIPEQLKEVDEMVETLDDTLVTLYRRGLYEHADGLGNQLDEGAYDRLKQALETAKKVKELVRLMEENQLACEDRLAQAPHVPVSRHDLDIWFYGNEGKPDPFGSGRQLFSMEKGLDAIFEKLQLPQPDKIAGDFSLEQDHRRERELEFNQDVKIAGQSGNAGVELPKLTVFDWEEFLQNTGDEDQARFATDCADQKRTYNDRVARHVAARALWFGYRLAAKRLSDTSKIDAPAEVGEAAKKRFDELTTGDNPYPYEWRSFYNGYLEGAFRRREESAPGEVRTGGLAEYGTTKEANNLSVGGELSGLPVEDQIRLYRASGGSVAGAKALRAKLTTSKIDAAVEAFSPVDSIFCPEPTSATMPEVFPKGCPLSPSQIRKMQSALAAIRSAK